MKHKNCAIKSLLFTEYRNFTVWSEDGAYVGNQNFVSYGGDKNYNRHAIRKESRIFP